MPMTHTDVRLIAHRKHESQLGTLGQATLKGRSYDILMVSAWSQHGAAVYTTLFEDIERYLASQHEGYTKGLTFAPALFHRPVRFGWGELGVTYEDVLAAPASSGFKKFASTYLEPLYPQWTFG